MKLRRWMAFALALVLVAGLTFTGVSLSVGVKNAGAGDAKAAAEPGRDLFVQASGVDPNQILMTVNESKVTAGQFYYWLGDTCYQLENSQAGPDGKLRWGEVYRDGLTYAEYAQTMAEELCITYLLTEEWAERYDCGLTAGQQEELAAYREELAGIYGGEEAYQKELAYFGLSEDVFQWINASAYLYQNLYTQSQKEGSPLYATEDEVLAWAGEAGYTKAFQIFIKTVDENYEPLSDEEIVVQTEKAERIAAQLETYEDSAVKLAHFFELSDQYNEDGSAASYPDGYLYPRGYFIDAFEKSAAVLEDYEISPLVKSDFGYHIIVKLPMYRDDVPLGGEAALDELYFIDKMRAARLNANIEYVQRDQKIDVEGFYEQLSAMRQLLDKEQPT